MNTKKLLVDPLFLVTLIAISGLSYWGLELLLPTLILSWFLFNLASLVVHEGWSHSYITPKNKVIKTITDLIGYATVFPLYYAVSIKQYWLVFHNRHHKLWKDEDDTIQWELNNNHWIVYLFTANLKKYKRAQQYLLTPIDSPSFIDKNFNSIILCFHLLLLILLGPKYYFFFVFLQVWLFGRIIILVGEILPHYKKKTIDDEHDCKWLLLLAGTNSYHKSHHAIPYEMNLGPGILKFFNLQYYLIKLLFNLDPKVTITN